MVRRRLSLPFTDVKEDDEVVADEEINNWELLQQPNCGHQSGALERLSFHRLYGQDPCIWKKTLYFSHQELGEALPRLPQRAPYGEKAYPRTTRLLWTLQ